ncbi:DUF488 family protein [Pseudoxanthomonas suwonensis]|uniref:DNA repair protein n=1 Tax=Pseudoxanthomonas suwonensis TaxID=314722 RepID=A0A0E3Z100_9GAMM|nr:DUF488 domain-containing protein [Pseudoxanthomonas suwonensis]AKC86848.1 hypothetical protein WQ53_08870 [Pseudoxanthomonas suwonensis]
MFHSIGHSTRPIAEFVGMLQAADVRVLADVRAVPQSRFNPQYGRGALAAALATAGIDYRHLPALGGRRSPQPGVPAWTNAHWRGTAFQHYADYALGERFAAVLEQLRALGRAGGCALMCAEADWRQCHRRIVVDHLLHAGEPVRHLLAPGRGEPARLDPAARVDARGRLTYPADAGPGTMRDLFATD